MGALVWPVGHRTRFFRVERWFIRRLEGVGRAWAHAPHFNTQAYACYHNLVEGEDA